MLISLLGFTYHHSYSSYLENCASTEKGRRGGRGAGKGAQNQKGAETARKGVSYLYLLALDIIRGVGAATLADLIPPPGRPHFSKYLGHPWSEDLFVK